MAYETRIEGLDKLFTQLRSQPEKVRHAAGGALYVEAEQTITAAKLLTPVDEGVLRASGHVQLPKDEDGAIVVELGFGGPAGSGNRGETNPEAVGYAVYVHENLTARHTVGQAKYLEAPVNQRRAGISGRIARRIKQRLRGV